MVTFLSPEWMDALTRAAADDDRLAADATGLSLILRQEVTRPDGSVNTYALRFDNGRLDVVPGGLEHPDVTLSQDYATAVALARGELSPQAALLAGRARVRGNSGVLMRAQAALASAQACFERVRSETVF